MLFLSLPRSGTFLNKVSTGFFGGVFLFFLLGPAWQVLAESPWPAYRHDMRRTGQAVAAASPDYVLRWSYATPHAVEAAPVIDEDGRLYFGDLGGKFYALEADGSLAWSFTTGGPIWGSALLVPGEAVYFGCADHKLYALSLEGRVLWNYSTGGEVKASPALSSDDTLYAASWDSKLYALDRQGRLKWSYATRAFISSSPAIGSDGSIYFGGGDRHLYALAPDGSLQWSYAGGQSFTSTPVLGSDGLVVAGNVDGKVYAFAPDGTLQWSYPTSGVFLTGGFAVTPGDGVIGGNDAGQLHAFRSDGRLLWSYTAAGAIRTSPVVDAHDHIHFGSLDGTFHTLSPQGLSDRTYALGVEPRGEIAVGADGTLYFGAGGSGLLALGKPRPVTPAPSPTPTPIPHPPQVHLAGFWDTHLTAFGGGSFSMMVLAGDEDGDVLDLSIALPRYEHIGNFQTFWLPPLPLGRRLPKQRLLVDFFAIDSSGLFSGPWPYLGVTP